MNEELIKLLQHLQKHKCRVAGFSLRVIYESFEGVGSETTGEISGQPEGPITEGDHTYESVRDLITDWTLNGAQG